MCYFVCFVPLYLCCPVLHVYCVKHMCTWCSPVVCVALQLLYMVEITIQKTFDLKIPIRSHTWLRLWYPSFHHSPTPKVDGIGSLEKLRIKPWLSESKFVRLSLVRCSSKEEMLSHGFSCLFHSYHVAYKKKKTHHMGMLAKLKTWFYIVHIMHFNSNNISWSDKMKRRHIEGE